MFARVASYIALTSGPTWLTERSASEHSQLLSGPSFSQVYSCPCGAKLTMGSFFIRKNCVLPGSHLLLQAVANRCRNSSAALATAFVAGRRPLAVVGGAVLVLLGARILMERNQAVRDAGAPTGRGLAWAYVSTLGLTITNPATIVSFAALAATLGLGTGGSLGRPAFVILGVLLGSAAWWCVLVLAASSLRARLTPALVRWISTASGLAIAVLGIFAVLPAFSG